MLVNNVIYILRMVTLDISIILTVKNCFIQWCNPRLVMANLLIFNYGEEFSIYIWILFKSFFPRFKIVSFGFA
jgi:hypothetical protein